MKQPIQHLGEKNDLFQYCEMQYASFFLLITLNITILAIFFIHFIDNMETLLKKKV